MPSSIRMLAMLGAVATVFAAEPIPLEQQNALVQKYCAVCHSDAVRNGGLSLQHFDAATAPPSLAAMMLSKLRTGALGAAGIRPPDRAIDEAFTRAFIEQSAGAEQWQVSNAPVISASILRQLPAAKPEDAALYRLEVSCNTATRAGEMQITWAPRPVNGILTSAIDGKPPVVHKVEGREKMGNGSPITTGLASLFLSGKTSLPMKTLRIGDLFPGESVEFPFNELPQSARQSLAICFGH